MKTSFQRLFLSTLSLLILTFGAIGVTPVHASTLVVTNTNNGGAGSLRDTLANANVDDVITFDASLSGGTIYLASTLTLTKNVTIDGSALASKITLSGDSGNNGTGNVRVLFVNSDVVASLDSLVITKGYVNDVGGGIMNYGTLTITNSAISGNTAVYPGGGIENLHGTLTITNSTITGNASTASGGEGGGITSYQGTMTISNSTISGNSAAHGGGIANVMGPLTITNSTISGNSAQYGGGIENSGPMTLTNSTISGNSATFEAGGLLNCDILTITNSTLAGNSAKDGGGIGNCGTLTITNTTLSGNSASNQGGGIYYNNGTLNYSNTIIANSIGADCQSDGGASIGTNTNNLVEDGTCSPALSGDPNLDARASNGGPTQTFALLTGSPAIDAGDDATCSSAPVNNLDQRGITRPVGAHCDIGAYEGEVAPPPSITFTSIAAQDGWVLESSENSNVGGTLDSTANTLRLGDDTTNKQYRSILSFNTSSIPDTATIIGVTLKIKQQSIVGGGNPVSIFKGFMIDLKNGVFGTSAVQITDFQTTASQVLGPVVLTSVGGVYSINLTGGKASINKLAANSGLTQIRLRFKLDDNNNAIANYLSLYSGSAAAANRPQLVITYTP